MLALHLTLSLAATLAGASPPADNTPPEVLVLPLETSGGVHRQLESRLDSELRDEFEGSATAECEGECNPAKLARDRGVFVVWGEVHRESRDYRMRVRLHEPIRGDVVAEAESVCEICGVQPVAYRLEELGSRVSQQLQLIQSRDTMLEISSTPSGSKVTCDGKRRGATPVELPVTPGRHNCVIEAPGYIPAKVHAEVVSGSTARHEVRLVPRPSADPDPTGELKKRVAIRRKLGIAALAAGGAGMAGSIPMFILNHRPIQSDCTGNNLDSNGRCRYRYTTLTAGIVMATAGAAVAATGVGLLLSARRLGRGTVAARVGPRGAHVTWKVRF